MVKLFVPIITNNHSTLFSVASKELYGRYDSLFNGYRYSLLSNKLSNYYKEKSFSFDILENNKNQEDGVFEAFSESTMSISLGLFCSTYATLNKKALKQKYDSITITGDFEIKDGKVVLKAVSDIKEKFEAVKRNAELYSDKKHLFLYISNEEIIPEGMQENNVLVIRYDANFPVECIFAEIFEDINEDTSTPQKYRNEFIETRSFINLKKEVISDKSCNCHIIKGKSNTGKSFAAEALCKYLVNTQTISDYVWFYIGDNEKLLELLRKEKEKLTNGGIGTNFSGKQRNYIKEAYPKVFDEFDRLLQSGKRCAIIIDNIERDIVDEVLSFFNLKYPMENNKYDLILTSWEGSRINQIGNPIKIRTINISDISLDFKELKAIADSVLKVNDYSKKYDEAPECSRNELLDLLFSLCRNYPGYIPLVLSALNEYSMEETLKIYKEKDVSDLSSIDKILTITFATMDFLSRIVLFTYLQIKNFDEALKTDKIIDILRNNIFNSTPVIDDNDIRRSLNALQQYSFLRERTVGHYEIKNAVLDFAVFSKGIPSELQTARDLIITPERKVEYTIEEKKLDEFKLYIDMISEKETLNKILIKLCKSDSSLEFFKALVVSNRDVNLNYICDDETPLQICARTTNDTRILNFLIGKGADKEARNSIRMSLLHSAAKNEGSTVLKYILEHGYFSDINEQLDDPFEDGDDSIRLACVYSKDSKSIELLLKYGANKEVNSKFGRKLLHFAATNSDSSSEVLKYILENNLYGNINETDIYGWTPLHYACAYSNNTKSIELLLKYGADCNVRCSDGWNLLHFTVKICGIYGNSKVLKYLLEQHIGGGINEADNHGVTPIHLACEYSKDIKLLLECGADMKACSNDGWTVLHFAAKNSDSTVLRYILEHHYNNNINEIDKAGCTPLHLACKHGQIPESIELLLKHGADMKARDNDGKTLLHYAAYSFYPDALIYILEHHHYNDINETDKAGCSPLHLACMQGQGQFPESIEFLLKYGADMNARDSKGKTLLHYAAYNLIIDALRYILEHHYYNDINEADNDGMTALFHAQTLESFKLLLEYGANPKIITSKENNILHAAVLSNRKEIVEYILNHLPMIDPAQKNLEGKTAAELASSDDIKKLFEK